MGELHLSNRDLKELSGYVLNELKKLSAQGQEDFMQVYRKKNKSLGLAYCLLLFLLGLQYAYLGKWGKQILYWITGAGLGIWALVLVFTLPNLVADYNRNVAMKELAKFA